MVGGGGRRGYEVEGAGTFAIEAKVFGERLGNAGFESLGDEISDCPCVLVKVA